MSLPEGAAPSTEATQPTAGGGGISLLRRIRWFVLLLVVAVVFAAAGGYFAGERKRGDLRTSDVAEVAQQQFDLGLQDLAAGRFELARQRFEYVIRLDPTYPQAAEQLAAALVGLNVPAATIAPLASPTPNLAPVADLFAQALAAYENRTGTPPSTRCSPCAPKMLPTDRWKWTA